MKNAALLVVLLFVLFGCNNSEKKPPKEELSKPLVFRDSLLYADSTTTVPFTGRYKSKAMGQYIEFEVKDGKKNGEFLVFYPNKTLQVSGTVKNDDNVGEWKYYRADGSLESKGFFEAGTANGKWTWYREDGKLYEEGFLVNGQKDGEWKVYKDSNVVWLLLKFKKDVLVDSIDMSKKKLK